MADISKLIEELNTELKKTYPDYKGVYFHGSRLEDKSVEESDYDLVFIFGREIDWKFEDEIWNIVYKYDLKYNIVIDARVYNTNEIKTPLTPFKASVLSKSRYYAA
jgi:predicted nucleotidyltransferase